MNDKNVVRAVKNFMFCWFVTLLLGAYCLLAVTVLMPVRFFAHRETFEWCAEYEADYFSDAMLEFTIKMREIILMRWSS
jgi:hypothetical protein